MMGINNMMGNILGSFKMIRGNPRRLKYESGNNEQLNMEERREDINKRELSKKD